MALAFGRDIKVGREWESIRMPERKVSSCTQMGVAYMGNMEGLTEHGACYGLGYGIYLAFSSCSLVGNKNSNCGDCQLLVNLGRLLQKLCLLEHLMQRSEFVFLGRSL